MTTTGDFSANASAAVLAIFKPPTQYVTQIAPRPRTRRVCICRKAGSLFIARIDQAKFAMTQPFVESKYVVAGNAEDMTHAVSIESLNEIVTDLG